MGRVADLLLLNFLCILCCIPIVTAGASITALYYVTLKMARDEESYIARSFFRSFKQNFKQATIINIIMLLTAAVLFIDLRIARAGSGAMYKGLFSLFIAFALIYAMILLYIYPILSKFFNSVKNTFVNAFLMSVRHLPLTLLMLVISASPLLLMWLFAYVSYAQFTSILIMLFILMGFSITIYRKMKTEKTAKRKTNRKRHNEALERQALSFSGLYAPGAIRRKGLPGCIKRRHVLSQP